MSTQCIKCNNIIQLREEILVCDMTGMKYNSHLGKCDCSTEKNTSKSTKNPKLGQFN
jgi:hypothetical protein